MKAFKTRFIISILFVCVFLLASSRELFAVRDRTEYFTRPQIGAWFGPITPVGPTGDLVQTALGGGIFFRYNTPYDLLKIGLDTSYQHFTSSGVNELTMVPVYGNMIFLLPLDLPLRFQFKAGAGGCWLYVKPDKLSQWDIMFMAGFELSFPAGRIVNIGLRIDYIFLYESYMQGARNNGHVINAGIMLYFNI
ncbi:MAG: hypothetical protein JXA20_04635 [Spirochaetes bacterium]|nr:hypothetical protein [Spirochaetota bacterium]